MKIACYDKELIVIQMATNKWEFMATSNLTCHTWSSNEPVHPWWEMGGRRSCLDRAWRCVEASPSSSHCKVSPVTVSITQVSDMSLKLHDDSQIQWRPVVTRSSGGIFWDCLVGGACYEIWHRYPKATSPQVLNIPKAWSWTCHH